MGNTANAEEIEMVMINLRICIWFFISVLLFFTAYYISRKTRSNKKNKEYKELISPILAEVLIDGKIDIKNLILTTIVELQIKKNIAIVNDNIIELLHKNDLNLHEIYLVDMIFQDKKVVTFNEINDRFIYARAYEVNFIDNMSKITDEIQTKLYEMKLFSRKRMFILNLVSYFNMLILINLPTLLLKAGLEQYFLCALFTILVSISATVVFFMRLFKSDLSNAFRNELGRFKRNFVIIMVSCIPIILTISMLPKIQFNLFSILGILGIYGVTFSALKFAKNNVLSNSGLKEYKKILELKNFLKEYDFRKIEGQNTYIIWDEYFAYAVALGISNPVISDIYKRWDKLDMTLWFTENLI